jgi:hypothetical protein
MTSINTSVVNQVPYLRTSREYPEDPAQLVQEVSKSYIDVAGAVNNRIIGIFPSNRPAITGETWFITPGRPNPSLRQVYAFSGTSPFTIPHGIKFIDVAQFTIISGTAYDGANYYPLPYVDIVAVTNQINVIVNETKIVITAGAGAPVITSGIIILQWLVN